MAKASINTRGVFLRARRGAGIVILKEDVLVPLGLAERLGRADQIGVEHDDEPLFQARLELYAGGDEAAGYAAATRFLLDHSPAAFDRMRARGLAVDLVVERGGELNLPAALLLACGERGLSISITIR